MDWISVKNSLPKHMQDIIIKKPFLYETRCVFVVYEDGSDFIRKPIEENPLCQIIKGVTHWSPIQKD